MEWGSKRVLPEVKQIIGIMLIAAIVFLATGVYSTTLDESYIANEVSSQRMINCSVEPERITGLVEGGEATVAVNCTSAMTDLTDVNVVLWSSVDDTQIAEVVGGWPRICYFESIWNESMNCSLSVRGLFLGRTNIRIRYAAYSSSELSSVTIAQAAEGREEPATQSAWVHVSVVRKERVVDHLFLGLVTLMVIIANVGMGCKIELPVVKEVLRRPIAPVIGFCCQYLIMPLVSSHVGFACVVYFKDQWSVISVCIFVFAVIFSGCGT
jgi:Sodium Bile acid symporter family